MPEMISGVFLGFTIVVITFKLHVPKEGSFPVQVKYIDVRRASTTLDVLLESRIDDYWNFHGRELSGPWTSFTQFTILSEKPQNRLHVVRDGGD